MNLLLLLPRSLLDSGFTYDAYSTHSNDILTPLCTCTPLVAQQMTIDIMVCRNRYYLYNADLNQRRHRGEAEEDLPIIISKQLQVA